MNNEKVIMNKDDYHTAMGVLKIAISNYAAGYDVGDGLYAVAELLDKAEPHEEDN